MVVLFLYIFHLPLCKLITSAHQNSNKNTSYKNGKYITPYPIPFINNYKICANIIYIIISTYLSCSKILPEIILKKLAEKCNGINLQTNE